MRQALTVTKLNVFGYPALVLGMFSCASIAFVMHAARFVRIERGDDAYAPVAKLCLLDHGYADKRNTLWIEKLNLHSPFAARAGGVCCRRHECRAGDSNLGGCGYRLSHDRGLTAGDEHKRDHDYKQVGAVILHISLAYEYRAVVGPSQ